MKEECENIDSDYRDCKGEVTFEPDPFRSEIHDDDTLVWMCESCRHESLMDI